MSQASVQMKDKTKALLEKYIKNGTKEQAKAVVSGTQL